MSKASDVLVESRCLLGESAMLLKGSVVATASIVAKPIREMDCTLARAPTRVARRSIHWTE